MKTAASQKIAPFLWFDGTAEDVARFHAGVFENGRITSIARYGKAGTEIHGQPEGRVMVAEYELMGYRVAAINGGPQFRLSPAFSFFVQVPDRSEAERLWSALAEGGTVLMPFDAYPWSPLYGWLTDRFGVSFQISWDRDGEASEPVAPFLTFTRERCGQAAEALAFYASVFPDSAVEASFPYPAEAPEPPGSILFGRARIGGTHLLAMDSAADHRFGFDESFSFTVPCRDQAEIDRYWDALVEDGGSHSACGWLKDRFGVSWQVVPEAISGILSGSDRDAADRAMAAVLTMTKIDVAAVERAAAGP